jgi:hypothetical protein
MLESQKRGSIATAKYFPEGYIVQQLFATVCITYGGIAYRSCSQSVCLSVQPLVDQLVSLSIYTVNQFRLTGNWQLLYNITIIILLYWTPLTRV